MMDFSLFLPGNLRKFHGTEDEILGFILLLFPEELQQDIYESSTRKYNFIGYHHRGETSCGVPSAFGRCLYHIGTHGYLGLDAIM